MPLPFSSGRIFLALCVALSTCSCIKSLPGINPPPNDTTGTNTGTPAITSVGTPVGNAVSKNIDASGGTITSDDGRIELRFPSGALPGSTTITIQPVTNQAPNGIGVSYQLLPEGTHFSNPVTMIFHYTAVDANGTLPYLFYVAYQDAAGEWRADVKKRDVDTVAKTITTTTSHFSIWSMGAEIVMLSHPDTYYEGQTGTVDVFRSIPVPDNSTPVPGEDPLPPLPIPVELPEGSVNAWKINGITGGNEADGTIFGSGNSATYAAPSTIDEKRTVQASAEVSYSVNFFNNGNAGQSLNKFIIFADITLLPSEFDFTVTTDYKQIIPVQGNLQYEDKSSFDLSIKTFKEPDGSVSIVVLGSGFQNQAPTCSPCTANYSNGSSWTCVPGQIGLTNITDVTFLTYIGDSVTLNFTHTGPQSWGAHAVDAKGEVGDVAPQNTPFGLGLPNRAIVALKDETQVYHDPDNTSVTTVTFTPK